MASFTGNSSNNGAPVSPLNAIVADIGRYATKIGWAGDDQPKSYFRSNVAILRAERDETESSSQKQKKIGHRRPICDVRYDYYDRPILGYNNNDNNANNPSGSLDGSWEVSNPVDPVTGLWYNPTGSSGVSLQDSSSSSSSSTFSDGADWADLIPLLLRHGYRTGLNIRSDDRTTWDYPLLLCERSYNPPPLRQQLLEVLMEDLQVSAVFLARDAVMQCYACGRTQGTSVDIGYAATTVTPVFEGYAEQGGIQIAPIGLKDIDWRILQHMDQLYSKTRQQQQVSAFLPLYQVKQQRDFGWKTLKRRSSDFHEAARLFWAQECRLSGAGIVVDTTSTTASSSSNNTTTTAASFQAPHKAFALPDGTEIHLSSQFSFQSANILLGRPQVVVAPPSTDHEQPPMVIAPATSPEQETRNALYQKKKQDWINYIHQDEFNSPNTLVDGTGGGGGGSSNNSNETTENDFSDAAAVGIAKRKTKRQKIKDPSSSRKETITFRTDPRVAFSNAHLNSACGKYFRNLVEHSLTSHPIAQMICEAAYRCDRDQQATLLGNVILGGGGSCLGPTEQAVPDFIKEHTEALIHLHTPNWRTKVLAPSFNERAILPWLGGSILASLGTFHEMYVTKADYDEWGSAIVNRKCP